MQALCYYDLRLCNPVDGITSLEQYVLLLHYGIIRIHDFEVLQLRFVIIKCNTDLLLRNSIMTLWYDIKDFLFFLFKHILFAPRAYELIKGAHALKHFLVVSKFFPVIVFNFSNCFSFPKQIYRAEFKVMSEMFVFAILLHKINSFDKGN